MRSSIRPSLIAEMNIVPYIDVMLVLLVIFMAATPVLLQSVTVDLPVAKAEQVKNDIALPVLVTINQQGEPFLNISARPTQVIAPAQLQAEVAAALALDPKRLVLVRADKAARYENVLQTMALLQQAGVPHIGLETEGLATG